MVVLLFLVTLHYFTAQANYFTVHIIQYGTLLAVQLKYIIFSYLTNVMSLQTVHIFYYNAFAYHAILNLWTQPVQCGLRCTPSMVFRFALVPSQTPDVTRGLSGSIGKRSEENYTELEFSPLCKIFIMAHMSFTHCSSIVRYSSWNNAVVSKRPVISLQWQSPSYSWLRNLSH